MSTWVWGVDPALHSVAFAFAPVDGGKTIVETLDVKTGLREGERLAHIWCRVVQFAGEHRHEFLPDVVWVEQPTGTYPNPGLMYATGVIQAALQAVLGVPVWTIPTGTWKKNTLGYGNASKEQVAAWVQAQGGDFSSQDEADAFCIAAAGRAMFLQGEWEAAA